MKTRKLTYNKYIRGQCGASNIGIAYLKRSPIFKYYVSKLVSNGKMNSGKTILTIPWNYSPGNNELKVYVNGQLTEDWSETDGNTITFGSALNSSDFVRVERVSDTLPIYIPANEIVYDNSNLDSENVQDAIDEISGTTLSISVSGGQQLDNKNQIVTVNSAGNVTLALPPVDDTDIGRKFIFINLGAGRLTIDAPSGDYIADSSSGGTIYSDDQNVSITLYLASETIWVILGADGTWTTT